MEETRYWCHACCRAVEIFMDSEMIKCSFCHGGFVEEIDSDHHLTHNRHHRLTNDSLSLVAPNLPRPRPRRRRPRLIQSDENEDNNNDLERGGELELGRRPTHATMLEVLQTVWPTMIANSNIDNNNHSDRERDRERDRESVIIINPSNQNIIVQGGRNLFDSNGLQPNNNRIGSIGDYFVGPGLDLLLQRLAENVTNRYGTPPAQKEAVEAMLTVKIEEDSVIQGCCVCLEDVEVGNEAKEMPCKHKFHGYCILTWLELHSSCPVCRYQLPASSDESKSEPEQRESSSLSLTVNTNRLTNRPFNSLFSSTPPIAQIESPHLIIQPLTESGSGSGPEPPDNESSGQVEDDH